MRRYIAKGDHRGKRPDLQTQKKVIEAIKDPVHRSMARLQCNTGARVEDLKKMRIEGTRVVIEKSKGGKTRSVDYSDRPQKLEQIKNNIKVLREAINHREGRDKENLLG